MKSCAYLLAALFVSPAWSGEPEVESPKPAVRSFELQSDTVRKIVRDTAATQFADVQVNDDSPVDARPDEFAYVPPENPSAVPPASAREPARQPSTRPPQSGGFLPSMFEILVDEAPGIEDNDDIADANDVLRCRVQKEQKTSPPGIDNCPGVD